MQPLTGVRDQPSATAFCQIPITNKALLQAPEAVLDTGGVRKHRRFRQLMDQKAIEPLLPALEIVETGFNLKRKCLLQRLEPTQQYTELLTVQSPGVLGSEGICQGLRASRSRQRRSQWRCCLTILSSSC